MLSIEKLKAKTYDYWSIAVRPKKVEVTGVRQHVVQDSTVSLLCKVMYIWINYFVCVTGFFPPHFSLSQAIFWQQNSTKMKARTQLIQLVFRALFENLTK